MSKLRLAGEVRPKLRLVRSMWAGAVLLAIAVAFLRTPSAYTQESRMSAIRAFPDTQELWCWYVVRNSAGKHGYAAQDARLNSFFPDRTDLFASIADFKAALRAKGLSHRRLSTSAPTVDPPPYIRALTDSEMKQLRE